MLLRIAEERVPEGAPSLTAALGGGTRTVLEATDPSGWLPMEIDIEVIEAVTRRFGPDAAASVIEARQREEMASALFAGFVKTVLHVFAASPASLVKQIPAGWARLFRNAGWVEIVSLGRSDAVIRMHRLPAMCIASSASMAALSVGLRSLYEIVGATGTVECWIEDATEGTVLVTFRWK
jgi:hypothetical protein